MILWGCDLTVGGVLGSTPDNELSDPPFFEAFFEGGLGVSGAGYDVNEGGVDLTPTVV